MLARASEQLMGMALGAAAAGDDAGGEEFGFRSYEVEQPRHDDLAASRLQATMAELSRDLWNSIADPQRLRMLESQPGGAKKEVLRRFAGALQGDAFALEQLSSESRVVPVLKRLSTVGPEAALLRGTWENMTKVVDKVNLHYSYLDTYMSDPDYVADNGEATTGVCAADRPNVLNSLSKLKPWRTTRGPSSSPAPLRRPRCKRLCSSCTT